MESPVLQFTCFEEAILNLGFLLDDILYVDSALNREQDYSTRFYVQQAKEIGAKAVFFQSQLGGEPKPSIYFFDYAETPFSNKLANSTLSEIQNKLWNSKAVPLAVFIYASECNLVNCTKPSLNILPSYLEEYNVTLSSAERQDNLGLSIKSGLFWNQSKYRNEFSIDNTASNRLYQCVKGVKSLLITSLNEPNAELIKKVTARIVLVSYTRSKFPSLVALDVEAKNDLESLFFKDSIDFMRKSEELVELFNLNSLKFNQAEHDFLSKSSFTDVVCFLKSRESDWSLFNFNYIPLETDVTMELNPSARRSWAKEGKELKDIYSA